jgi:hypothetical protein
MNTPSSGEASNPMSAARISSSATIHKLEETQNMSTQEIPDNHVGRFLTALGISRGCSSTMKPLTDSTAISKVWHAGSSSDSTASDEFAFSLYYLVARAS